MPDITTLQIDLDPASGKYSSEYRLTECHIRLNRTYDCWLPHSDAHCRQIEVSVVSPIEKDLKLVEWFVDNSQMQGVIEFRTIAPLSNEAETTQRLLFDGAYLSSLSEHYHITEHRQRELRLVIVPQMVEIMNLKFPRPL